MKRSVILGALLAVFATLGVASNAEAFFGCCRRSCNTCYSSPVYTYYYAPQPVCYQPVCQPACSSCQAGYYGAPAAYAMPVAAYQPVYAVPAPYAYGAPYGYGYSRVSIRYRGMY